jgi:hypothetical protein
MCHDHVLGTFYNSILRLFPFKEKIGLSDSDSTQEPYKLLNHKKSLIRSTCNVDGIDLLISSIASLTSFLASLM